VIVSVRFREETGFQVLTMLATDEATRHIPVVIHVAEDAPTCETVEVSRDAAML
jgi:hypothetical protein